MLLLTAGLVTSANAQRGGGHGGGGGMGGHFGGGMGGHFGGGMGVSRQDSPLCRGAANSGPRQAR